MALLTCLRSDLNPESMSEGEAVAYCLELGIPSRTGATMHAGKTGPEILRSIPGLPRSVPQIPHGKTPYETMIRRLIAAEMVSGYAMAFDPSFARRTFGLGEEALDPLIEFSDSNHALLGQNATWVLARWDHPKATEALRRVYRKSADPVRRIRALGGLVRLRDSAIVPDLVTTSSLGDKGMRAAALHALGYIGGDAARKRLRTVVEGGDADLLWSALPALARLPDSSEEGRRFLRGVERRLRGLCGNDDQVKIDNERQEFGGRTIFVTREAPKSKWKILHQFAVLALAASQDESARKEVLARVKDKTFSSFHRATWFVLVETLVGMGPDGVARAKSISTELRSEIEVRVHALRMLDREGKCDAAYLEERLRDSDLAGIALQLLEWSKPDVAVTICREAAAGKRHFYGDDALLALAQVGGRVGAWDAARAEDLLRLTQRNETAVAQRRAEDQFNLMMVRIMVRPPVWESLLLECGRTGSKAVVPYLASVLRDPKRSAGRAEAALALGAIGGPEAVSALLLALEGDDPWMRFCAYRSLKTLSGKDHFADWIFGSKADRARAAWNYKTEFASKNPP